MYLITNLRSILKIKQRLKPISLFYFALIACPEIISTRVLHNNYYTTLLFTCIMDISVIADIDECNLRHCDNQTTTCTNTMGSFSCNCKTGYKPGNNKTFCEG